VGLDKGRANVDLVAEILMAGNDHPIYQHLEVFNMGDVKDGASRAMAQRAEPDLFELAISNDIMCAAMGAFKYLLYCGNSFAQKQLNRLNLTKLLALPTSSHPYRLLLIFNIN